MRNTLENLLLSPWIFTVGSRWKIPTWVCNFFPTCIIIPQQHNTMGILILSWTQTLLGIIKIQEPWMKASPFLALRRVVTACLMTCKGSGPFMKWMTFSKWLLITVHQLILKIRVCKKELVKKTSSI